MVKAATMAGAGSSRGAINRKEVVDADGDYGMSISSPELIIPIVALILLVILAFVGCLCKWLSCCSCFGKKGRDKDLELQLGRKTRVSSSLRKKSESLKSSSSGGGVVPVIKRSPSCKTTSSSTRSRSEDRRKHKNSSSNSGGIQKSESSASSKSCKNNHSNSEHSSRKHKSSGRDSPTELEMLNTELQVEARKGCGSGDHLVIEISEVKTKDCTNCEAVKEIS